MQRLTCSSKSLAPNTSFCSSTGPNAQKSKEYLEINPNGRIPTLVDKSLVLSETAAIVLELVDQRPDAGLRD
jgi:glutathione S-transferase